MAPKGNYFIPLLLSKTTNCLLIKKKFENKRKIKLKYIIVVNIFHFWRQINNSLTQSPITCQSKNALQPPLFHSFIIHHPSCSHKPPRSLITRYRWYRHDVGTSVTHDKGLYRNYVTWIYGWSGTISFGNANLVYLL